MRLSVEERKNLEALLRPYKKTDEVQSMRHFVQHGAVSTYDHCGNVARVSYWLNRRLHLGADEKSLAAGAFLHDFYLYDWHDPDSHEGLHGFTHPAEALRNAEERFHLSRKERDIIQSHMWPLTLSSVPHSREAVIVCVVDKYCSALETLFQRKKNKPICR